MKLFIISGFFLICLIVISLAISNNSRRYIELEKRVYNIEKFIENENQACIFSKSN